MTEDDPDNPGDAAPPDATDKRELTAKDLLTASREDVEKQLDAATVEQLAAWFDLPSYQQVADDREANPTAEDLEQRQQALAAVDAAMVGYLSRHDILPAALLAAYHVPPRPIESEIVGYVPGDHRPLVAEPYDRLIPGALEDDLKQCVPQALLRDLHRPNLDIAAMHFQPPPPDRVDPQSEVREAIGASYRVVDLVAPGREARQALLEAKALRGGNWGALGKDPET